MQHKDYAVELASCIFGTEFDTPDLDLMGMPLFLDASTAIEVYYALEDMHAVKMDSNVTLMASLRAGLRLYGPAYVLFPIPFMLAFLTVCVGIALYLNFHFLPLKMAWFFPVWFGMVVFAMWFGSILKRNNH